MAKVRLRKTAAIFKSSFDNYYEGIEINILHRSTVLWGDYIGKYLFVCDNQSDIESVPTMVTCLFIIQRIISSLWMLLRILPPRTNSIYKITNIYNLQAECYKIKHLITVSKV